MAIPPPPEQPWNPPQEPTPQGPPPHQAYGQSPYGQAPGTYGQAPGSYGQSPYAAQPYGIGPYGMPPAPPATNGLAIASLITGIVCCLPPLGLVLGLVALSQIKKRGDSGKGMAIAGIVLSCLSIVLTLVMIFTGGFSAFMRGVEKGANGTSRSVTDLRVGQCFNSSDGSLEGTTYDVDVVGCEEEHDAEVFGTFDLADSRTYPGDEKISTIADKRCATAQETYTGGSEIDTDFYYLMPDEPGWRLGDRGVTCVFGNESGEKLTGSLRGGGTGGTGGTGGPDGSSGTGGSGGTGGDTGGTGNSESAGTGAKEEV
ncbi:DUF4190 domain-containing protein [Streptomyces sp. NPDC087440]|uniref:DUF4190 domain-containing protein n=1 Tax=Streptomyces sp. NPDC087440 TaxID=3365790 RepID=UPI003819878F